MAGWENRPEPTPRVRPHSWADKAASSAQSDPMHVIRQGSNAKRLRTQAGAAVLVHHDDRAAATRREAPSLYPLWKPPVLHLVGRFLRNGVARTAPVAEASGSPTKKSWTCRAVPASSTRPATPPETPP